MQMNFSSNKKSKNQIQNNKNKESSPDHIIKARTVKESELAAFVKGSLYGDEHSGELIQFQDWREY